MKKHLFLALAAILPLLFFCTVLADLPDDDPPGVATPQPNSPLQALSDLGCTCEDTFRDGYRCDSLPAFRDNEWQHEDLESFASNVAAFSAKVEIALQGLGDRHYVALQGWADKRPIIAAKKWSKADRLCRKDHNEEDVVSNLDLAYLRSCELWRHIPRPLRDTVELLNPVDFNDPRARMDRKKTYSGDGFKAVILFVVIPNSGACR